jgi:hypothetical protein
VDTSALYWFDPDSGQANGSLPVTGLAASTTPCHRQPSPECTDSSCPACLAACISEATKYPMPLIIEPLVMKRESSHSG